MRVELHEILPGLVLFLDPEVLLAHGGECTVRKGSPVYGAHHFVCTGVDEVANTSEWVPLLSRESVGRESVGREKIYPDEKRGHPKFTKPTSYYSPHQFWRAPNRAIVKASECESSRRGARNRVLQSVVDLIVGVLFP